MTHTPRFRSLTLFSSRFNLAPGRFRPAADARPRGAVSRLRPGAAFLTLILSVLLLSTSARAQVTYTGTTATQNFGSQAVGSASAATTLSFSVAAGTTVGSIGVLTQGAPNLDFTTAAGGTCASQAYTAATTCTVNVTFKPRYPGVRMGAVVFYSGAGASETVLGEALIYGIGTGPQIVYPSNNTPFPVGSGFSYPEGLAVDANGDVFVADGAEINDVVKEIAAVDGKVSSSSAVIPVGGEVSRPWGVAVDASGDVFVASDVDSVVKEIVAAGGQVSSSSTVKTVGSGFGYLAGLAVDAGGDVFVADGQNDAVKEIVAVIGQVSSSSTVITVGSGFTAPYGVAVDGAGNVFVADYGIISTGILNSGAVDEIVAVNGVVSSTSTVVPVGSGFKYPTGVAVDASGDVFVADLGNNSVKEIVAVNGQVSSGSTVISVDSGGLPFSVAVDASGDVFVGDLNGVAEEIPLATPPSLTFTNTGVGSQGFDSPQTVTVSNDGNADLTFPVPASGNNPSITSGFTLDSSTTCPELNSSSTAGTLAAGTSCTYAVDFIPVVPGTDSGSLSITDNSLNANPAITQTVPFTLVEPHLAFTTPPPGNLYADQSPGTVAVSVEDSNSQVVTTSSATVTLTVTGPNSYAKAYTATASSGVATFGSLASLNIPGSYTYTATDIPDGLTAAVAAESVIAQPPVGGLDQAVDSVTYSTTVGQSGSLQVSGWAADPQDGSPMSNVTVYIDGTSIGTPTPGIIRPDVVAITKNNTYLLSGYQLVYSASSLSLGTHMATVVATDSFGLSTTFGPRTFTVGATAGVSPPFGGLESPEDNVTFSNTVGQSDSVEINGWAADPTDGSPLGNVTVYIDGNSIGAPALGLASPDVAAKYNKAAYGHSRFALLYSAAPLSLGAHKVTVVATDTGGRSTTLGPVSLTVAAAAGAGAPFGAIGFVRDSSTLSTTVSQSDSVEVSGWVADQTDGAPLSNLTVYIDGMSIGTPTLGIARKDVAKAYQNSAYTNSGYDKLYPASSLSLGTHAVTVVAIDSGGRSKILGPVTFTVQ